MDYDLIVVKTLERVYKNYYYIIRGVFYDMKKLFDQYGRTILVIVVVAALILLTAVAKGPISNVVTGQITTLGDLGGSN